MEGAVERLEIWTAGLLLLVAMLVGMAGTLAWVAETPRVVEQTGAEASPSIASATALTGTLLQHLADSSRNAGRLARSASYSVPGGLLGAIGALLAGVLLVPLATAAAAGVRRAGRVGLKPGLQLRSGLAVLRSRLWRPAPVAARMAAARDAKPGTGKRAAPAPRAAPVEPDRPSASPAANQVAPLPAKPGKRLRAYRRLPTAAVGTATLEGRGAEPPRKPIAAARAPALDRGRYDEDVACLALHLAARLLADCGASCSVLGADVLRDNAQVLLDLRPGDQARLDAAFATRTIETADAALRWRPPAIQVQVRNTTATPSKPALLVPLLDVGRRRLRYVSLDGWRHLGIYGDDAHAAAHHLIATLLCQRRPDELGLAILGHGWASMYRATPHWVEPPGDGPATAEALARSLRRGATAGIRPLLVVVVEPDGATMSAFGALLSRLSLHPAAPMHLLLVQRRLQPLGRRLYPSLPALVTAGSAAAELLPAVRRWPRAGSAVVLIRGQRWAGRPLLSDETAIGALARRLATYPRSTVPVLW